MDSIYNFFKFRLNEMLTHTLSPDKAEKNISDFIYQINKNGFESEEDFIINYKSNLMIIELKNKYTYDEIISILSEIFATGYYVSQYYISTDKIKNYQILSEEEFLKYWKQPKYKKSNKYQKDINNFKLYCEPKWDNSIKIDSELFHLTKSKNTNDILKYGLMPKSGKKKNYHPERIYLSYNMNDILVLLNHFRNLDKIKNNKDSYDVLKIDTNNLKSFNFNNKEYNIVFYKDSNSNGVYTYDRINPDNITLYKQNL